MMKLVLIIVFIFTSYINAKVIINNPNKVVSAIAGRKINLRLLGVAHNPDAGFLFKKPRDIVIVDNEGGFFLIDDGKVLQFNKKCEFTKIVVRKGNGPGEATYLTQLYKFNNNLFVNTGFMQKLMIFDFNGNLLSENRLLNKIKTTKNMNVVSNSIYDIIGANRNRDFIVISYSPLESTSKTFKQYLVVQLSKQNKLLKNLFKIPMKTFTYNKKHSVAISDVITASNDRFIYFCNTARYEIKKYNIESNKIEAIWKRNYVPVCVPDDVKGKQNYGETVTSGTVGGKTYEYKAPLKNYFNDIQKMFFVDNKLWVITSTVDNDKGVLVDLFDSSGKYIDNFYMPLRGNLNELYNNEFCISDNNIVIREIDSEYNYKVVHYRIQVDVTKDMR